MRCGGYLKADVTPEFFPKRGFPSVHFQLLGIELGRRKRRVRGYRFVCRCVFGTEFQRALLLVAAVGEAIDRKAQIGQYLVIDDVIQENRIRVEGFLRQDYAVIKCTVFADGYDPGRNRGSTLVRGAAIGCEEAHRSANSRFPYAFQLFVMVIGPHICVMSNVKRT